MFNNDRRASADLDRHLTRSDEPVRQKRQRKFKCDVCTRTDKHTHCPECGSTEHVASQCDMLG